MIYTLYSGSLHRVNFLLQKILCVFLFLFATSAFSQNLTLTVNVTNETCPGNGALALSTQNAAPSPPVNYQVFLLPNTTNPIWNSTNPNISGLNDGNYLIIASQAVNGTTHTAEQQVTIQDNTNPLDYEIESNNAMCGSDGSIEVTVNSGNPVTYEILAGPVTAPPQTSNTFNNLPAGTYNIRVIDNCGTGIVTAHTLLSNGPVLQLSQASFPDIQLPACDLITASNFISSTTDVYIAYPLTVNYTVYPPNGGSPVYFSSVYNGGDPENQELSQVIPFYYDTDYYYDITVTDPCGIEYTVNNNLVRQKLTVNSGFDDAGCGSKMLIVSPIKFVAPYTITFTNVPEGFDPEEFNVLHPGPFYSLETVYGEEGMPIPYGLYEYTIEDACGRTASSSVELEVYEPEPEVSTSNNDCNGGLGRAEILLPGYIIETAIITSSPEEYEFADELPFDVSDKINNEGKVRISGLAPGTYYFTIIDECGVVYEDVEVIIPEFTAAVVSALIRPDCEPGKGTVRIAGYSFTSVQITTAPPGFQETLPYDVSSNIDDWGILVMDGLAPGSYVFTTVSECGGTQPVNANISAYTVNQNNMSHTLHCGSFDLSVSHSSNGVANLKFWLQKKLSNDTWGHPESGVIYNEGTEPDGSNSLNIINNQIYYALLYTGEFRVIKVFEAFGPGNSNGVKKCIEVIYDFSFFDDLQITNIINLTCTGDEADVQVVAEGVLPMTYRIVAKNGQPLFVDNGQDNIFADLESAQYTIEVEDPCGNIVPMTFNVAELPSLVNAGQPDDMEKCDEGGDGIEFFNLSEQDSDVLNGQDPDEVILTYHATLQDAESNTNPLPANYETGTTTVYARVELIANSDCVDIVSFDIIVRGNAVINMNDIYTLCEGDNVTITASNEYVSYAWSNGATTPSITVTESGFYTLEVIDQYGCPGSKTIEVISSSSPVIYKIDTTDWTENNNTITVILEANEHIENFEYSIDGINYQDSNVFTGLETGEHTIYVRDKYECGDDAEVTYLLTYPKFFTPNGDGINEFWRIEFSIAEPDMLIYVYDRYGKLITGFGPNSQGWDGTLNGTRLPATDYWFVVIRQNGQQLKGHFSLIR